MQIESEAEWKYQNDKINLEAISPHNKVLNSLKWQTFYLLQILLKFEHRLESVTGMYLYMLLRQPTPEFIP